MIILNKKIIHLIGFKKTFRFKNKKFTYKIIFNIETMNKNN